MLDGLWRLLINGGVLSLVFGVLTVCVYFKWY